VIAKPYVSFHAIHLNAFYRVEYDLKNQKKTPNTFGDLGLGETASKRLKLSKSSFTALQDHQKYSGVLHTTDSFIVQMPL